MNLNILKIIIPVILFTGISYGQQSVVDSLQVLVNSEDYDKISEALPQWDKASLSSFERSRYSLYKGQFLEAIDRHDLAFQEFLNAKDGFASLDSLSWVADLNYEIYDLLIQQNDLNIDKSSYLEEFLDFAKSSQNPLTLARAYSKIAGLHSDKNQLQETLNNYRRSVEELKKIDDTLRIALIEMNIGSAYRTLPVIEADSTYFKTDSALYFYQKSMKTFKRLGYSQFVSINYNNQALAYDDIGQYDNAVKLFDSINDYDISTFSPKVRLVYYNNQLKLAYEKEDTITAGKIAQKYIALVDSVNDIEQNKSIARYQEKYNNEKLRADNLEIKAKNTRNQNIAYGLGGLLLLGSIIGFLVYRNTKRKQRIAEQEKEIEVQKTEKLLKDQELSTIDAMIAGQEKERQRLASDLHDSVGATLSAAKMQFEHLKNHRGKLDNEEEFYERTQTLLEEAYSEVRSMAHAKNSGVIAKHGLLPAVKKLARNASATGKLNVEVQDYGLDQRMEGSLEIAVFRMVQELVTNIIKHAEATEANISLTQHEDVLNLVVEDNGKGFKVGKFTDKDGMGLGSIEKRVEHMEGQMEVDSTPGKGASIIIDIPL